MLSYEQRAKKCTHPITQQLFQIMQDKKTNLAASIDVISKKELIAMADQVGPEICVLKTHIDILEDFDNDTIVQLKALSKKHHFIIFEDRKFADIGNTVQLQYEKGIYRIAEWAPIVNAHTIPGPGIVEGLKKVGLPRGNGLLLLAEMSSQGNLITKSYTEKTLLIAEQHKDFVIGFIATHKLTNDPTLIHMTPGVQIAVTSDSLGQSYITPSEAIIERKVDVIIVGRGIYQADRPDEAAKTYRKAGWEAYEKSSR